MTRRSLFHRIADEREPESGTESFLQRLASIAEPLYGAGAFTNRLLHDAGLRDRKELGTIVLSVGNIVLGGTGKTPFTEWMVRWLKDQGRVPAILTRGYGREDEDQLVVVHDGRKLRASTHDGGDEPILLARSLEDVPVIACSNRYRAGRLAERRFAVDTLVLDDGFQHHALVRQGDIVLVDSSQSLDKLRVFPRGTLREPLGALGRAHLIVLTRCDRSRDTAQQFRMLRKRFPHVPVVRTRFVPTGYTDLNGEETEDLDSLRGKKVILACGVANPKSVRRTAKDAGVKVIRTIAMEDHARPDKALVHKWDRLRRARGADFILVTAKDAVKLRELGTLPEGIKVLNIALEFLDSKDETLAGKAIRSRLRRGRTRGLLK